MMVRSQAKIVCNAPSFSFLDSYDSAMSRHCFLLQKQLVDKELKRFNKFSACPDVPNVELISQHARVLQDLINGLPFSK